MKSDKNVTLYNVIFPLWFAIFIPPLILIPLIGNFFIDAIVLLLAMKINKTDKSFDILKKVIFKTWIFGFIADIIGVAMLMRLGYLKAYYQMNYSLTSDAGFFNEYEPFKTFSTFSCYLVVILVVGGIIAGINNKILLKQGFEKSMAKRIGIILGLFTAPWSFLIPTYWFFHWQY